MFIKGKTYEELVARAKLADELEKETKRLAGLITSETKDCKMGPWCRDCKHLGTDYSVANKEAWWNEGYEYATVRGGCVKYCKKHLHDKCPEFTQKLKDSDVL